MTIKSDRWIQRMAETQAMISPFEAGQIRERDGEKLISYGTSSYGYDVRCADEFKVFTNIHSAVVDPKNFDDKSFVDIKSEVCIIPRTPSHSRVPSSTLKSGGRVDYLFG